MQKFRVPPDHLHFCALLGDTYLCSGCNAIPTGLVNGVLRPVSVSGELPTQYVHKCTGLFKLAVFVKEIGVKVVYSARRKAYAATDSY